MIYGYLKQDKLSYVIFHSLFQGAFDVTTRQTTMAPITTTQSTTGKEMIYRQQFLFNNGLLKITFVR